MLFSKSACAVAVLTLLWTMASRGEGTVVLDADGLRDRLYDASTATALQRAPIQAAVLHLMDEALVRNPGVLSSGDTLEIMRNAIAGMTHEFGAGSPLTGQELTLSAIPYLQQELSKKLPAATVNSIQTGWKILTVAELQGQFPSSYSNLTTALPSGAVFSGVQSVPAGLQALRRETASRMVALALPERIRTAGEAAFRESAAEVMADVTSVKPQSPLDTIVEAVPGLRENPFVQDLAREAHTAKQVIRDVNTMRTAFANILNALHHVVATNENLLGQISRQNDDVIGSESNSQSSLDVKTVAQQISADMSQAVDIADNSVTLLSTLFKLGGDSKAAQQVASVGAASIKVAKTVGKVADAVGKLSDAIGKKTFSFATALSSFNLIGAALDVINVFDSLLGGPPGPSPDEIIYDEINQVRQDIANLSEQMNDRFDRVDAALTNILGKLDYNLEQMSLGFNNISNKIDEVQTSLFDLQGQVQHLDSQVYSWLRDIDQADLYSLLHDSLGFEEHNRFPMPYSGGGPEGDFISFKNSYWNWAVVRSVNSLYQPMPGTWPDCFKPLDLYNQLTRCGTPEENVNYINEFILNNLGLPRPYDGVAGLANPRVWSIAANGLAEMCIENPASFRSNNIAGDFYDILQGGNRLNTFLNHLIAYNTNAPNTNLWIAACNGYRSAVQDFTNAILAKFGEFGSNPFTNQYLSLVTPRSTTLQDGDDFSATVVSVTAIACSPTADGMPIYFLDQNTLRRLDTNGRITTLAGSTNAGFRNGAEALFNEPRGLAVAPDGRVFVADTRNHAIRVWETNGLVATLAGYSATVSNAVPVAGALDGTNAAARFNLPQGLLLNHQGDLLVADTGNHAIRKVTPDGLVTTFAGTLGQGGLRDGLTVAAAQGTNQLIAQFWTPEDLLADQTGTLYVLEGISRSVREIGVAGTVVRRSSLLKPMGSLFPQSLTQDLAPKLQSVFRDEVVQVAMGGSPYHTIGYVGPPSYVDYSIELLGDSTVAACGSYSALSGHYSGGVTWLFSTATAMNAPGGLSNVVAIAAGGRHALALKADGTVVAWGDNYFGECNLPAGLSNIVSVAAGAWDSLALKRDGTVVSWGRSLAVVPPGLTNVVAIAAAAHSDYDGGGCSLALRADGTVVAWGYSDSGECDVPVGLSNVVAVSAGNGAAMALKGDGTVVAWGTGRMWVDYNDGGAVEVDTGVISRMPAGLSNVVAVSLGLSFAMALKSDGTAVVWGSGLYPVDPQQNGSITMADSGVITLVPENLNGLKALGSPSSQAIHAVVLKRDGTIAAWGDNAYGECNLPRPAPLGQALDSPPAEAAFQQFAAGVVMPDGRILIADKFGLRLFDNSDRIQRQAAGFLLSKLTDSSTDLYRAANVLKGWHLLLRNLASYALSDALANDDALHTLLFGSDCVLDTESTASLLRDLINKADWRPAHLDFGAVTLQRIELLQSHLLDAVIQLAQKPNPASLPLVTDTLSRLNLLLATHNAPVPPPALSLVPGTNQASQVLLNGYPYVHYTLQSSGDLQTWSTNSAVLKDGEAANLNTTAAGARFYRAAQVQ